MRGTWLVFGLVAGVLAVTAAFWLNNGSKTMGAPLRIGTNPWPGYEFLHLAEKKGFFAEENVAIKLVRFSSLEDTYHAFESGQVDGMTTTLIELLQTHENGKPAQAVLMTDFSNGSDVVIARKEIKNVADLKGKTIAIEPASLSVFIIARALEKSGLSLDDVKIVGMNPTNMSAAILSGKVDALHAYPPVSTEILKHADKTARIFDSAQIPGEIVDILSFSPDIVAQRMDDMQAIRRAWDKTLAYAQAHPEESNKIMAEVEGISPEEFQEALNGIKTLNLAEQRPLMARGGVCSKTLVHVAEILHKSGYLKDPSPHPDNFLVSIEDSQP